MGARKLAGFTIIETMLVVSISGVLIVALLVGTTASLNAQRYRDATDSLKSLLQQQYSDLSNVQNDRNNNWTCGPGAAVSSGVPSGQIRGQSPCVLIGKYVQIENENISEYAVVGYKVGSSSLNDVASLKNNYVLNVVRDNVVKKTMEWGTQIAYPEFNVNPSNGALSPFESPRSPRKIGILFVRSPDSGQIYTFSNKEPDVPEEANIGPASLNSLLQGGAGIPGQSARTICIDPNGLAVSSDRAILIGGFASSASAIEVASNDYMQSNGIGLKC